MTQGTDTKRPAPSVRDLTKAVIAQVDHCIAGYAAKQVDISVAMANLATITDALTNALNVIDAEAIRIAELEDALRPFAEFSARSDASNVAGIRKLDPHSTKDMTDAELAQILKSDHTIWAVTGTLPGPHKVLSTRHFRTAHEVLENKLTERHDDRSAKRATWFNGCDRTVPEALRFLADNERPSGGEQPFNSAHLYQLAAEIEAMARQHLYVAVEDGKR